MADLPSGAAFGSLVHGVLEVADPFAPDLEAELRGHVEEQRAVVAGRHPGRGARGRAGPAPPHLARPARRRADPRRDRAARPAVRARLRDPAGRRRRRARRRGDAWPTSAACWPGTSTTATRCVPTPTRLRTPGPRRPVAARLPVRLDRRGAAGARPGGRATSSSTTRPTGSGRPTSRSPRRPTPATGWSRRCCTPTTRCRRCSTSWSCTATCAGASPATTRRSTSAACSTSTCAACAAPTPRRTTATRPASSPGSRRPRW